MTPSPESSGHTDDVGVGDILEALLGYQAKHPGLCSHRASFCRDEYNPCFRQSREDLIRAYSIKSSEAIDKRRRTFPPGPFR